MDDSILYTWENSVENFFIWLKEVCGLHKDDEMYVLLKHEIRDMDDLKRFVDVFDGDFNNLSGTVERFLLRRVS